MDVLLDSHALIWAVDDPSKLGPAAAATLRDPDHMLHLSMGSVWEIGIKVGKNRLPLSLPFRRWIDNAIATLDLHLLPITVDHVERQVGLPPHHDDPLDRLLAAQALVEGFPLVSGDAIFDAYGVNRIWT
jgi:PIN domain nuclease of toxin-antitoxin system